MSGATIALRYLLAHDAGLTAVVAADRIVAGVLPRGTTLPAVEVTNISTVRQKMANGTSHYCRSRVQVMVYAANEASRGQIMNLVLSALPNTRGSANGIAVDHILHDQEGPDLYDDDLAACIGSHDYMVAYND